MSSYSGSGAVEMDESCSHPDRYLEQIGDDIYKCILCGEEIVG